MEEGVVWPLGLPAAAQAFPDDLLAALELEADDVRVGRFLIVVEAVAAAGGGDADREIDAQAPAAQVDHVDAVVAEFAVAPVPEPVPVVMQVVGVEGPARRRALPEIVVEPLGYLPLPCLGRSVARLF